MRKLFFIFISIACVTPCYAQDVYIHQASPSSTPNAATPQTAPSSPAAADTIQDFSKRYYDNCMCKQDAILKGDAQKNLCQCSSDKMVQEMTVNDVKTMTLDTPEGLAQRNRMLIKVYAPCMQYPARALIYDSCVNGPDVKTKVPNYPAVCGCMADGMGKYVQDNGPGEIAKNLAVNPNDLNPLQTLMNGQDFQATAKTKLMACLIGGQ